jgi:hypothetical protein
MKRAKISRGEEGETASEGSAAVGLADTPAGDFPYVDPQHVHQEVVIPGTDPGPEGVVAVAATGETETELFQKLSRLFNDDIAPAKR